MCRRSLVKTRVVCDDESLMRAACAIFLVLALAGCSGGVAIDAAGPVSEYGLAVGDCFDDPDDFEYDAPSIIPVACSQPHDNEIYAIGTVTGDEYPAIGELDDLADDYCLDRFEVFIGIDWEDSIYDYIWIAPDRVGWDTGDRDVVCVAYDLDLAKLTGSLRGIGE